MSQRFVHGWKKEPFDERDLKTERPLKFGASEPLPTEFALPIDLPVWDQGSLGCCTGFGFGLGYKYEVEQLRQADPSGSLPAFEPSRLFTYYITRELEGTINEDSGCYIRDVFKAVNKTGVAAESKWPYIISKFKQKPTQVAYRDAKKHKLVKYAKVPQDLDSMKKVLVSGAVIVFGFNVYESFDAGNWDSTTGMMPLPNTKMEDVLGGHCVSIIGYSDKKKAFLIQNSWSADWALKGKFWMPYKFALSSDCDDFWCIEEIKHSFKLGDEDIDVVEETLWGKLVNFFKNLF